MSKTSQDVVEHFEAESMKQALDTSREMVETKGDNAPAICVWLVRFHDQLAAKQFELDEARRIGLSMCRRAHDLVTVAGTGEYAQINEARARLEGVEDVRDLATLLAHSEERARNSERAHDVLRARVELLERLLDQATGCLEMKSDRGARLEWAKDIRAKAALP